MWTLLQDLRIAIRQLRRYPGFTILGSVTIALGIGASTGIFSVIKAVLLNPLPYPQQDRLVWLHQLDRPSGVTGLVRGGLPEPFSYPDFLDIRAQTHSFTGIASYRDAAFTITGTNGPEHLEGEVVSGDFFRVLGTSPLRGRPFDQRDEKPGSRVVILSQQLCARRFGSGSDVIGRTLFLGSNVYTIVGVMPAGFSFPLRTPPPLIWTTLADDAEGEQPLLAQRGLDMLEVIGRLRPGVSIEHARNDLDGVIRNLIKIFPNTNGLHNAAVVEPELEHLTGDARPALRLSFAAVTLLLIIACINVAGLALARVTRRTAEMALRLSLGARRWSIVRQVLTESILLSLIGGIGGVVLSEVLVRCFVLFAPEQHFSRLQQVSIDGLVLVFAAGVSTVTGIAFGLLPALVVSAADPANALWEGSRTVITSRGQGRLHSCLVIGETALGLMLLMASSLHVHSLIKILNVKPGFNSTNVITASMDVPRSYHNYRRTQIYDQLLSSLTQTPGVKLAAAGWPLPLSDNNALITFHLEGHPTAPGKAPYEAINIVTPAYFHTMGIELLKGRDFSPLDNATSNPVLIVNEKFAQKYFPGRSAIGKRVRVDVGDGVLKSPMREIIGVVANTKRRGLTSPMDAQYFIPYAQCVIVSPDVVVRTAENSRLNLARLLRRQLARVDSSIPVYRAKTMGEFMSASASAPRFQALILTSFSVLALVLSAVGLYAVLSYMVVQRTNEIGLRVALGAQRQNIIALIVRRGVSLTVAGLAIGFFAAVWFAKVLSGLLFEVETLDATSIIVSISAILGVALIASLLPALSAGRLDPINTLRQQ